MKIKILFVAIFVFLLCLKYWGDIPIAAGSDIGFFGVVLLASCFVVGWILVILIGFIAILALGEFLGFIWAIIIDAIKDERKKRSAGDE